MVNILGVLGVGSWVFFRGIVYPKYLVYPYFDRLVNHMPPNHEGTEIVFWPGAYISLMLWILLIMDYVWIFAICKGLVTILTSPKSKTS